MKKLSELFGKSEHPLPVVYLDTQTGETKISKKVLADKIYKPRGIMITPHIEVSVRTEAHIFSWEEAKKHAAANGAHLLSAKDLEAYIKARQDFKEIVILLQKNEEEHLNWLWQGQPTWCDEEDQNNSSLAYTIEFEPADCRLEEKSLHFWCRLVWYH